MENCQIARWWFVKLGDDRRERCKRIWSEKLDLDKGRILRKMWKEREKMKRRKKKTSRNRESVKEEVWKGVRVDKI